MTRKLRSMRSIIKFIARSSRRFPQPEKPVRFGLGRQSSVFRLASPRLARGYQFSPGNYHLQREGRDSGGALIIRGKRMARAQRVLTPFDRLLRVDSSSRLPPRAFTTRWLSEFVWVYKAHRFPLPSISRLFRSREKSKRSDRRGKLSNFIEFRSSFWSYIYIYIGKERINLLRDKSREILGPLPTLLPIPGVTWH